MEARLERRVAYGRTIRDRAACLIEAHGQGAEALAAEAAAESGVTESERQFWHAVAARVARLGADSPAYAAALAQSARAAS